MPYAYVNLHLALFAMLSDYICVRVGGFCRSLSPDFSVLLTHDQFNLYQWIVKSLCLYHLLWLEACFLPFSWPCWSKEVNILWIKDYFGLKVFSVMSDFDIIWGPDMNHVFFSHSCSPVRLPMCQLCLGVGGHWYNSINHLWLPVLLSAVEFLPLVWQWLSDCCGGQTGRQCKPFHFSPIHSFLLSGSWSSALGSILAGTSLSNSILSLSLLLSLSLSLSYYLSVVLPYFRIKQLMELKMLFKVHVNGCLQPFCFCNVTYFWVKQDIQQEKTCGMVFHPSEMYWIVKWVSRTSMEPDWMLKQFVIGIG